MRQLVLATLALLLGSASVAEAQKLTVGDRQSSRTYTAQELRTHPSARDITIERDLVYKQPMSYRAVPTAALLKGLKVGNDDYVQARATDNFSVAIPARLMRLGASSDIEAFVAVEDAAKPWPAIPAKAHNSSAGPFTIVWRAPAGAAISSEYWAYKLAALTVTDSPTQRWPGLAVEARVPAADPVRRGLDRFVAVCMACHRFNGEGEGTQGPDLGRPMNPVEYFQPAALKKYIRDPAALRAWPEQKMPGFAADSLPDSDIDAIVAWLAYKAGRR